MVSNYHFMPQEYRWKANKVRSNFIIAAENDFATFCEKVTISTPERWMCIDGKQPANLQMIRFDSMNNDLNRYSEKFNFDMPLLGHLNPSKRAYYGEYMCVRAERAIAEKLLYWFEEGYYERESFGENAERKTA